MQGQRGTGCLSASLSTSAILISLNSSIDIACIYHSPSTATAFRIRNPFISSSSTADMTILFTTPPRSTSASQANSDEVYDHMNSKKRILRPHSVQQALQALTTTIPVSIFPLRLFTRGFRTFPSAKPPNLMTVLSFSPSRL